MRTYLLRKKERKNKMVITSKSQLVQHHWDLSEKENAIFYIICFSNGNKKILSLAEVQENDLFDYAIASRYYFYNEANADQYGKELALKHNLRFTTKFYDNSQFLD